MKGTVEKMVGCRIASRRVTLSLFLLGLRQLDLCSGGGYGYFGGARKTSTQLEDGEFDEDEYYEEEDFDEEDEFWTSSFPRPPALFDIEADLKREKLFSGSVPVLPEEEEPYFLIPEQLPHFETFPLVRRSDGKQVCPFARVMGLPENLTEEIGRFAEESGLADLFWSHTYGTTSPNYKLHHHACPISPFWPLEWHETMSPKLAELAEEDSAGEPAKLYNLKDGRVWATIAPSEGSNWPKCDIHWIDVVDEPGYEETLKVITRAGFDNVLRQVGEEFHLQSLAVTGIGFMAITHCKDSNPHGDNYNAEEFFFQLLIPLVLPKSQVATLNVGSFEPDGERELGPIRFRKNVGIMMSGDTLHQTPDFDFHDSGELRVVASIYFSDLNDDLTRQVVAGDGTAIFPPKGNTDWLAAQEGRHWFSLDSDFSLVNDRGRYPLGNIIHDEWGTENCQILAQAGKCSSDLFGTRMSCLKTCGVFIPDHEYFTEWFPNSIFHDEYNKLMNTTHSINSTEATS